MKNVPASPNTYFHRVAKQTPTRLWVNNAMPHEAESALQAGAVGASTNPTYPSKLEPGYLNGLIDGLIGDPHSDDWVAEEVYRRAVTRLQGVFLPLYRKSGGRLGHVAIQGDPRVNTDPDAIMGGALRYFKEMDENIIVKVPATPEGAEVLEKLTAMGYPTIATMGFSVDQAIYMAEAHRRGLAKTEKHPVCYITYIAGILEDYLKAENAKQGSPVSDDAIEQAGCAGHRAAYRVYRERKYEAILIGGGARGVHHFTDLVGGDMAITIGWSLLEDLVRRDEPVESHIEDSTPSEVVSALDRHFPDFGRAYRENSLRPEEFGAFGPVVFFQRAFLKGVDLLLKAIRERRAAAAP